MSATPVRMALASAAIAGDQPGSPSKLGVSLASEAEFLNQFGRSQPKREPKTAPPFRVPRGRANGASPARHGLPRPASGSCSRHHRLPRRGLRDIRRAPAAGRSGARRRARDRGRDRRGESSSPWLHRAARCRDAGREAAGHVEIVELRRQPHHRLAIGRDGDRTIDDGADADVVEDGKPLGGGKGEEREPVHVGGEEFAREFEGRPLFPASRRAIFPAADGKAPPTSGFK